jgi:hypothetical protein
MCGAIDSVVDAWHGASAPIVDSQLGRFATNVATGGLAAPAFAAYDISRGADPLKAAAGGAMGYFGGQAGADMFGGGGDAGAMPGFGEAGAGTELSAPASAAPQGLAGMGAAASTPALSAQGLGDMGSSSNWGGLSNGQSGMVSQGQMPAFPISSSGAVGNATDAYRDVSSMGPTATVGQGAPYTGELSPSSMSFDANYNAPSMWDKITGALPTGKQAYGGMQLANGLQQMFARQNVGNAMKDRYDQLNAGINSMYAPGSPEALAMEQAMARKDAAGGRNSQYGTRAVDLQAAIAKAKAQQVAALNTGQNSLLGGGTAYQNTGLSSMFDAMGNINGYNKVQGGI